jgi:hypothetical protein
MKEWSIVRLYECRTDFIHLEFQRTFIMESNILKIISQPFLNMKEELLYAYSLSSRSVRGALTLLYPCFLGFSIIGNFFNFFH